MVTPSQRRTVVNFLQASYGVSERRACRVTGASRASHRYRSQADPQHDLRLRVRELAAVRVRYGYRRIHVLLRREGWPVNHKRVYRIYRDTRAWRSAHGRHGADARLSTVQHVPRSSPPTRPGRWTSSPTRSSTASASAC